MNFTHKWNHLDYHKNEFTDSLQLDSRSLKEFFWNMIADSTKYSKDTIKKMVTNINDIILPSTTQNQDDIQDLDVEMKNEDEEKESEIINSVCLF